MEKKTHNRKLREKHKIQLITISYKNQRYFTKIFYIKERQYLSKSTIFKQKRQYLKQINNIWQKPTICACVTIWSNIESSILTLLDFRLILFLLQYKCHLQEIMSTRGAEKRWAQTVAEPEWDDRTVSDLLNAPVTFPFGKSDKKIAKTS